MKCSELFYRYMLPHMDRPADRRAGCKHRCTDAAMNYLKAEVMEMCHSEGLYQIDLLNGSKERVSDREYWAQKKGQAALDERNAPMIAGGIAPRTTKFETDKAKLRRTIRDALSKATSLDEFSSLLLREGVTVKESRGRLSYLTPDRSKPITARKLGDDFDRTAVLSMLEQNAARAAEKAAAIPEYPASIKERLQRTKPAKSAPKNDGVQRMVDIAAKKAEGKGRGYEKWATMHNLKQMAATLAAYQQYGFSSPEELDEALTAAHADMQESLSGLKALEATISDKKELQRNLLPSSASYRRDTTKRNIKKVRTSSSPFTSRAAPASAVVAIPSRRTSPAETTKTAVPSSLRTRRLSTARIFFSSPERYLSSALLARRSGIASMHS